MVMRRLIKYPSNYVKSAVTSNFKDDPYMQEIAAEAAELGVETKITYSSSGRGTAGTSGDENIMFYVPEELYSKELRQQLSDILARHRAWDKLERRGRTSDGKIKLRQW